MSRKLVVEIMPRGLRPGHAEAGKTGRYPGNGALRFSMSESEAREVTDNTPWMRIVHGARPDDHPYILAEYAEKL